MLSKLNGMAAVNRVCKTVLPRGLALFFGGFSLLNLLGEGRVARFDATIWWLDLRFLPPLAGQVLVLTSAVLLVAFGLRPPRSNWRRFLTAACTAVLALISVANALAFYLLWLHGGLTVHFPIPLSLFVSGALALILAGVLQPHWLQPYSGSLAAVLVVSFACGLVFPLAQMFCFGKTDYRRPAEVAVVLGARVYADGRPSDALADRVRTACQLYRQGWVGKLLVSGGPGDGAIHETEAMKQMAIKLGVRSEDILIDDQGWNSQATARNSAALLARAGADRVLVVSHFYHLPRLKLAYHRIGREVYTVPAQESYLLRQLPYNMAREVAAFWAYYWRPLV